MSHRHFLPPLPLELVGFVTVTAAGGGPILPHPGFVTLPAEPPDNVILLDGKPALVLTGESLALRTPIRSPFSFPSILLPENTLFARPGDAAALRRLIPRRGAGSDWRSARDGRERRID